MVGLRSVIVLCLLLSSRGLPAQQLELVLQGEDGRPLPHAVVSLPGDHPVGTLPPDEAVIDQQESRFEPHVSVVAPGALVHFPNSDDTRHHVYSFSPGNSFELKLYRANEAPPVVFEAPGVVTLGCNIHDSMKAYVVVTSDTTARTSDQQGRVILSPPLSGQWPAQVEVWHPQLESELRLDIAPPEVDAVQTLVIPVTWQDPQQGKSDAELEALLKQFAPRAD